ncbi:MAG: cobalamin-binding protein [bacterium]
MSMFSPRLAFGLALLVVIGFFAGGCAPAVPSQPSALTATTTTAPLTHTATDAFGILVTLAQPPQRIISLGPSATEMVYALGIFDRLAAVTTADDYPSEVSVLEKVGSIDNPSLEKILALQPDLVLAVFGNPMTLVENLRKQGVPVFGLNPQTVPEVLIDLRELGDLTGTRPQADQLLAGIEEKMDSLRQKVATATATLPTVYLETWPQEPFYTFGRGTFGDDLVTLAGGTNIATVIEDAYPALATEYIFFEDPQTIVLLYPPQEGSTGPKGREGWSQVAAVATGRILQAADPNVYLRPGPRIVQALDELARFLHPEWFVTP